MHRLNIVEPSMKTRSRAVTINVSGQVGHDISTALSFIIVAFVLSLFVPHLSFWCPGRAVLHDCGICLDSSLTFEPAHDKTYNKTSKDSDQPVHPLSTARVFMYPSFESLEVVEGTCNLQRLIRLRKCAG